MRNISFFALCGGRLQRTHEQQVAAGVERGFPVLGGVAPGEHLLEEVENVIDTRVVVVPEPHRAVVYIHGAYQRVLRALVRVILHYKKQVPREALVRLRRVAAHRKAGGLVIQPRRVGVGRVVDIHAVRKYHSRLGTQRGEGCRTAP